MPLNPRLSVSAMLTPQWPFERDLTFWESLDSHHAGLFQPKLDAYGNDAAIAALKQRLLNPHNWGPGRGLLDRSVDVAAALGGCTYGVTGGGRFGDWQGNLDLFAEAIGPGVARAKAKGVRVGIEPTTSPLITFVHNLRDGLIVADRTDIGLAVDVGNCWMERDVLGLIRSLGDRIAIVQLSDWAMGTIEDPGREKVLPGFGELPVHRFVEAALDAGYDGQFEVELNGRRYSEADLRRAITHTSKLLDEVFGTKT
jgi:sugar phosphate isomerase/epimerase